MWRLGGRGLTGRRGSDGVLTMGCMKTLSRLVDLLAARLMRSHMYDTFQPRRSRLPFASISLDNGIAATRRPRRLNSTSSTRNFHHTKGGLRRHLRLSQVSSVKKTPERAIHIDTTCTRDGLEPFFRVLFSITATNHLLNVTNACRKFDVRRKSMEAVFDAAVLAQRREEDELSRPCGEEGSYGGDFRGMGCDGCPSGRIFLAHDEGTAHVEDEAVFAVEDGEHFAPDRAICLRERWLIAAPPPPNSWRSVVRDLLVTLIGSFSTTVKRLRSSPGRLSNRDCEAISLV